MNAQEFIEQLPIGDKYKSVLVDGIVWTGAVMTNQYEQTFMTILLSLIGLLILIFRGGKAYFDMKKSYSESEITRLNHERIEEGYKTELKVSKTKEEIKKSM